MAKGNGDAVYQYFKSGGKWGYSGRGWYPPVRSFEMDRRAIRDANEGEMPGITGHAEDMYVIVLPDDDCERLFAHPVMLKPKVHT